MISVLPRWVWSGAWALAFIAGFVNVAGLLGFEHRAVTHMTGVSSMLSAAAGDGDWGLVGELAAILASFLAGTILSGFLIQDSTLKLGRRYGVALMVESLLLLVAVPLHDRQSHWGVYAVCCAAGLQNAMVSAYSGAVVRTTHLTGMFTDVGILLGHALRGMKIDLRKLSLHSLIILGFILGGITGTMAFRLWGNNALFIPAGLTAWTSLSYGVYRIIVRRRAG